MKILIYLLALLYLISPYDLIPDFLIGAGWIDDIIVLGLLWWYHFIYRKKKQVHQQSYQRYRYSTGEDQRGFNGGEREADVEDKTRDEDPHKVLGLKNGATIEEIKAAYRQLANQYHPDKVMHLGEEFRILAEKRFKDIQKAYQRLTVQR
ncbi:MAG: DnaJ domain-containing protein [Deltaproteobacteria bacterium]|nr:DnaJ domain-containing protein [Deltaproteobacteria bacterium]